MSVIANEPGEAVLLNTFTVNKKICRVYLHRWILIWESQRAPHTQFSLSLKDVISVNYISSSNEPGNNASSIENQCYFVIHFAKRRPNNNIWRHHRVSMEHSDARQCASWVKTIRNYIDGLNRPKRLLLFVNPYGGKKKALKIFNKHGKPLFKIASLDVSVIISQRPNQISDLILSQSLENFDAIACVGGDGTFSEVFNGLILRECKDKNINPNDPNVELPSPKLPVGVIPGGSTDTVAYCIHGTTDIQTCILHIVFGECIGLDLAAAFDKERLLRLYASVMSYGYLGDVARDSEKFRWMGPKRYDYSGFKKFLTNAGYEGEIKLLKEPSNPIKGPKCLENCDRCANKRTEKLNMNLCNASNNPSDWKTVKGKFFMVNGANVTCACARSPNGIAPYCHIGDGCVDLVLVRHTSIFNNLRLLLRLSSKTKTVCDLPFVEVHRTKEFQFRAPFNVNVNCDQRSAFSSVWNCDGEVIKETDVRVRVHCQVLKVFSRGLLENVPEPSCFCTL